MSTVTVMVEEVEEERENLKEVLESFKEDVPEANRAEFEARKQEVENCFEREIGSFITKDCRQSENSSSVVKSLSELEMSFKDKIIKRSFFLKSHPVRGGIELLYRKVGLLSPNNKVDFIADLMWFSQRGEAEHLDLLWEVKNNPPFQSEEISFLHEQALAQICKRAHKDLLNFFQISHEELPRIYEAMILNQRTEFFAPLPKYFVPQVPSQAVSQLREIKKRVERLVPAESIEKWLKTKQQVLVGQSPLFAIKTGKAFLVLQILMRLEEGPY